MLISSKKTQVTEDEYNSKKYEKMTTITTVQPFHPAIKTSIPEFHPTITIMKHKGPILSGTRHS